MFSFKYLNPLTFFFKGFCFCFVHLSFCPLFCFYPLLIPQIPSVIPSSFSILFTLYFLLNSVSDLRVMGYSILLCRKNVWYGEVPYININLSLFQVFCILHCFNFREKAGPYAWDSDGLTKELINGYWACVMADKTITSLLIYHLKPNWIFRCRNQSIK